MLSLQWRIGFAIVLVAPLAATEAHAAVEAELDLRLVDSSGRDSFMDGGFGKLRYDAGDEGLKLGRVRLAWRGSPGGNWHANVDLSAWSLDDHNLIDVVEAWLEWRPVPTSPWRSNVKIGAFYPPVSLEHRAPGWTNPYTLSSSALNTWVGEELRTIGAAYELEYRGIASGGRMDIGAHAAVFGWNDPAGVIVGLRGFAMHDRQTPVFGRIGTYTFGGREQRVLFSEIDNRPGYHVGVHARSDTGIEVRALHYDNRGNPAKYKASIQDYAWDTRFDSIGLRYDAPQGTTLIVQWLDGYTAAGPGSINQWDFKASFALVAHQLGRHRLAARYDRFRTTNNSNGFGLPLGREAGHALTLGWTISFGEHVDVVTEWLSIDSRYNLRSTLGENPVADENLLQLALRLRL